MTDRPREARPPNMLDYHDELLRVERSAVDGGISVIHYVRVTGPKGERTIAVSGEEVELNRMGWDAGILAIQKAMVLDDQ